MSTAYSPNVAHIVIASDDRKGGSLRRRDGRGDHNHQCVVLSGGADTQCIEIVCRSQDPIGMP